MTGRSRIIHASMPTAHLFNQDYGVTITDSGPCRPFTLLRGRLAPEVDSTVTGLAGHAT